MTPAFVDGHAHTTDTGIALTGVHLAGARSLGEALALVESASRASRGRPVLGHGWDETAWPEGRPPTRAELDRASHGGVVYLSRVDVHSAVVSSALASSLRLADHDGWDDTGRVEREAHAVVRDATRNGLDPAVRDGYQEAALRRFAASGVLTVHEMSAPHIAPRDDLAGLVRLADASRPAGRGALPRRAGPRRGRGAAAGGRAGRARHRGARPGRRPQRRRLDRLAHRRVPRAVRGRRADRDRPAPATTTAGTCSSSPSRWPRTWWRARSPACRAASTSSATPASRPRARACGWPRRRWASTPSAGRGTGWSTSRAPTAHRPRCSPTSRCRRACSRPSTPSGAAARPCTPSGSAPSAGRP